MTATGKHVGSLILYCERHAACDHATAWLRSLPAGCTLKRAWETCADGSWMLWLAGELDIDRKMLVRAACKCARDGIKQARTALRYVPKGDDRPAKALDTAEATLATAEAWCDGKATDRDIWAASIAAGAASTAAWAASAAARAASTAAWAASAAAGAASAAARAASAAARAASTAAGAASAAIVRKHIPYRVMLSALATQKEVMWNATRSEHPVRTKGFIDVTRRSRRGEMTRAYQANGCTRSAPVVRKVNL